jgi:sporulation protein YlmC with PRC-barrel domain
MQAAANAQTLAPSEAKAARVSVSIENTARATRVLGRKVIDSSSAVILGFVDELYFHLETQQIVAIRVRARFRTRFLAWLRGKKSRWMVPIHLVHSIGTYAVVVEREQASSAPTGTAAKPAKKTKPQQKPPSGSTTLRLLIGQSVVTDAGELLGKLLDVLLNDTGTGLQHFEVDTRQLFGSHGKRRLISARTRALGDVLLVPADDRQTTPLFARASGAPLALAAPEAEAAQAVPESLTLDAPEWLC